MTENKNNTWLEALSYVLVAIVAVVFLSFLGTGCKALIDDSQERKIACIGSGGVSKDGACVFSSGDGPRQ